MKKLLAIELIKLSKLRSLRVILLIYFGLAPLIVYGFYSFFNTFMGPLMAVSGQTGEWNPFVFPDVWGFVTWSSSWFNILIGVIVVIVMTNEYSYRTLKQNIIDGASFKEVIIGKFFIVFILSTIVTLYTLILGIIYGAANSETMDIWNGINDIPKYYFQTICYFSFAFFFASVLKKPAVSIIFFIVSFIAEFILGQFLKAGGLEQVYAFFPLNSFSNLVPIPILQEAIKMAEERTGETPFILENSTNLLVCLFYMTLFFLISLWVIKRRDL
tara:strand:+ start:49529 stop:50344 length:816 start_codon:yes stop_codon:yes gene_type:complete